MKNKNLFLIGTMFLGAFILMKNKSISLPALKAKEDIINKSYADYYNDADSVVTVPFAKQHESTLAEGQTIGGVGGGLTDIFKSIRKWRDAKKYNAQLAQITTADEADLFYEA